MTRKGCTRHLPLYGDRMSRTVYVNGAYLPEAQATVSIFDRGFLMADGVYEVTSVLGGKLIDFAGHCIRLARSLRERFGNADAPESFKVSDQRNRHPEWMRQAEPVVRRVADVWNRVGVPFPFDTVMEAW